MLMSPPVAAWRSDGHSHITGVAVTHLPQPLRGFFEANLSAVRSQSGQEPPGTHYIKIDYYPEFASGSFPRNMEDLVARYGQTTVQKYGTAPWTYANYVDDLTSRMAAAHSKTDWQNLISVAAAQAHYIEDLHNPIHLTLNIDGQLTGNDGIHSRYEGEMIGRHLADLSLTPSDVTYLPSVIDAVFDGIDVHYDYLDDILAADDEAFAAAGSHNGTYYSRLWTETDDFTRVLLQRASEAVANGWYTAWFDAGRPMPMFGLVGDYNTDAAVNAADYVAWRVNGSTLSAYNMWRTNFGRTTGSGTVAETSLAAPEPGCCTLLISGVVMLRLGRHHPRRNLQT
jgi:hypothetical protein